MSLLFKAGAAFGLAAFLTGAVHLDTPRWQGVAAELHGAHPRVLLTAQIHRLQTAGRQRD